MTPVATSRTIWLAGLPVLLAIAFALSSGQSQDERTVRAAYLFNLTRFAEWPQKNSELLIGVLGKSDTGDVLEKMLDGKTSEAGTIHVVLSPSDDQLQREG